MHLAQTSSFSRIFENEMRHCFFESNNINTISKTDYILGDHMPLSTKIIRRFKVKIYKYKSDAKGNQFQISILSFCCTVNQSEKVRTFTTSLLVNLPALIVQFYLSELRFCEWSTVSTSLIGSVKLF